VLDHAGLDFSPPAFQSRISEAYIFDADRPDAHVCATLSIARSGVPHAAKSGRTFGAFCTES
jgi:hypothetical protein